MAERTSFTRTLAALRDSLSAATRRFYDDLVKHLRDSDVLEMALNVGGKLPEFALPNGHGRFVQSSGLLADGPLVINFYRGQWCPFCSASVNAMAAAAPAIKAIGATVIGITPEVGGLSLCAGHKHAIDFEMLCDFDNGLALECGLLFRLTDDVIRYYADGGLDLTQIYGNGSWFLPVPASYVVRSDGTVTHAFLNPDFRYRADPQELLSALSAITGPSSRVPHPNRASGQV